MSNDEQVAGNLKGMDDLDFEGWNNADWHGVFAHHHTDDVLVDCRLRHASAAAPAPDVTIFTSAIRRPDRCSAFFTAAATMIAVPC